MLDEAALQRLLDRQAVLDLIMTYSRAFDRCDLEQALSVFHENAQMSVAGLFAGKAEESVRSMIPVLKTWGPTAHYVCNALIEVEEDVAHAEYYCFSLQRMDTAGRSLDGLAGTRVLDRCDRRNGVWKVSYRRIVMEWNIDLDTAETWYGGQFDVALIHQGGARKGGDDPSYTFRGEAAARAAALFGPSA